MTPERTIQKAIEEYLVWLGIYAWPIRNGATWDARGFYRANTAFCGISDILGTIPPNGRILAIEVKSKKGKVSPAQEHFLATVRKMGGVAGVCRSIEDVDKLLSEAGVSHIARISG